MKRYTKLVLLLLSFGLWGMASLTAANSLNARDSLRVNGSVFHSKDRISAVRINLYVNNQKYNSVAVERSNRFYVNLPLNEIVTLEIIAPGYYAKRIMFDTNVPDDHRSRLTYQFDMDLYSRKEMEGVNTSLLDFPVGLVQYQKGAFSRNKKYTKQMKEEYMRLLEDVYVSESED